MHDQLLYIGIPLVIGLLIMAYFIRPRHQNKRLVPIKVTGTMIPATNGEKPKDVRPGLQLVEHGD